MRGEFGPGEVYNRRITKHVQSLLPDHTPPGENYTFGGRTVLDRETNPGKPAGGTCQIRAYVGADGQLTVLEKSTVRSGEETLWACQNRIRRTHDVDGVEMEPFSYHVQTKIQSNGTTKGNQRTVDLTEFTSKPVYGGREAQAAVLLAERVAAEKERDGLSSERSCCSLHDLPSLPRVISRGWLGLDWEECNELLGPEAETIAASASVSHLADDRREAAKAKGIEIFARQEEPLDQRVGRRRPANDSIGPDWQRTGKQISTELPEDMSPTEAEQKLAEMRAEIREMKTRQ